jgi:hypothetical protein
MRKRKQGIDSALDAVKVMARDARHRVPASFARARKGRRRRNDGALMGKPDDAVQRYLSKLLAQINRAPGGIFLWPDKR